MHKRQDEWTAAMSTRALKESDGPSNFHLMNKHWTVMQKASQSWNDKNERFILKNQNKIDP